MVLVDGAGVPLGVHLSSANLAECQLAEATLAQVAKPQRHKLRRIIADRGYDSRPLHDRMARQGIELLAPHLSTRTNRFQDGRKLRRYRRRWIIERTNAWLFNFRRLVVRYEHRIETYRAFLYLACALIALRQF
jgi:transposase